MLEKIPDMPEEIKQELFKKVRGKSNLEMSARHRGVDRSGSLPFDQESLGTRRMFMLVWKLYQVVNRGGLLVIDELEASLHPLLIRSLLTFFQRLCHKKGPSQLVFSTHQTHLLNDNQLRRDQLWLTEKDQHGCTRLESLWDYKPRKGEALEKNYLAGRYGGIPDLQEVAWNG